MNQPICPQHPLCIINGSHSFFWSLIWKKIYLPLGMAQTQCYDYIFFQIIPQKNEWLPVAVDNGCCGQIRWFIIRDTKQLGQDFVNHWSINMMEIDHHVFPISNGDFPILGGCFSHLQTTPVKLLYVLYVVWQHFVTLIDYVPILKKSVASLHNILVMCTFRQK